MQPIKVKDLNKESKRRAESKKVSALVEIINDKLLLSYSKYKTGAEFAYASFPTAGYSNAEKELVKEEFLKAGFEVSLDRGAPYDEKPEEIVVCYDTRGN